MQNFKEKGHPRVFQYNGKGFINGKECFLFSNGSGIDVNFCELTDEKAWVTFYIRLCDYDNGVKTLEYVKSIGFEGYTSIGCFYISASEDGWDKIIDYMESLDCQYEMLTQHPRI